MSVAQAVRWKLPSLDAGRTISRDSERTDCGAQEPSEVDLGQSEACDRLLQPQSVEPVAVSMSESVNPADVPAPESGEDELAGAPLQSDHSADLVALRDAAYAEGLEAGRADGMAEGLDAGRLAGMAELQQDVARVHDLLGYLAKPLNQCDDQLEDELVALSVAVARQLVRRELTTSPGEIVPVVREALAVLPSSNRRVSVQLHPEDAELVRNALVDSAESAAWDIAEDPLMSRGGCRVDAGFSHVDATLESRLKHIAVSLAKRERSDD